MAEEKKNKEQVSDEALSDKVSGGWTFASRNCPECGQKNEPVNWWEDRFVCSNCGRVYTARELYEMM